MRAVDSRCDVVSSLISSWHDGSMRDADRSGYEQHLLFCPPCLAQNDKARLALGALHSPPSASPPPELLDRLVRRLQTPVEGA